MTRHRLPSLGTVSIGAGAGAFLICETEQRYPRSTSDEHTATTGTLCLPPIDANYVSPEPLSTG